MRRLSRMIAAALLAAAQPAAADEALPGDAGRGAVVWKKCKACHQLGKGARNTVGPHLNDVFDRRAGSVKGFRYSRDMRRAGVDGLVWDWQKLDAYIENPRALVTRTRMNFRGIANARDRADLLTFLRTWSASPANIPEAAPTAPRDPPVDAAILSIKGDREFGRYLGAECTTCHQASGADRGIPSITGWPVGTFVTVMHAYKNKVRPHAVMRMIAGRLSNEEIAALAAYFAGEK